MKKALPKRKSLLLFILLQISFFTAFAQPDGFVTITTTGPYYTHQNQIIEFLVQVGNTGTAPITNGQLTLTPTGEMEYLNLSISCLTAPGYSGESICPDLSTWDQVAPITGLTIPEGAVLQFNLRYYINEFATLGNNVSLSATYSEDGVIGDLNPSNNNFTLSLKTQPTFSRKLEFKITAVPTSLSGTNTFDLLFVRTSPYKWRDDTLSVPVTLSSIQSINGTSRQWGEVTTNAEENEVYISFDYSNPAAYWTLPATQLLPSAHPRGDDQNINELLRTATISHLGFFNIEVGAFPYQIYTDDSYLDLTNLLFDAKPYFQNENENLRAYDFLGVINNYLRNDETLYPQVVEPDSFRCFFETPIYYRYTAVKSDNDPTPPATNGTARIRIHGNLDLYIGDNVLPVKLGGFDLVSHQNQIVLQWQTLTEENNRGFYIQHSTNGKDWKDIAFVASQVENGFSSNVLHYEYKDHHPPKGMNYYRLKQIDFDLRETYSTVRSIKVADHNLSIKVYPNPATDKITLENIQPGTKIYIYNTTGSQVYFKQATNFIENISISELPKGVYYIRTVSENNTVTNKIIKQ